jgi:hypothetical protein
MTTGVPGARRVEPTELPEVPDPLAVAARLRLLHVGERVVDEQPAVDRAAGEATGDADG